MHFNSLHACRSVKSSILRDKALGENNVQEIQVPDDQEQGNESTSLSCYYIRGVSYKAYCFPLISGAYLYGCSSGCSMEHLGKEGVAMMIMRK